MVTFTDVKNEQKEEVQDQRVFVNKSYGKTTWKLVDLLLKIFILFGCMGAKDEWPECTGEELKWYAAKTTTGFG